MRAAAAILMLALTGVSLAVPPDQPDTPRVEVLELGPLNRPFGVDFDAEGNMIVVEYTGGRIFRKAPDPKLEWIGGSGETGYGGDGGPATGASFDAMHSESPIP